MSKQSAVQTQSAAKTDRAGVASGVLQRQCACGQHSHGAAECSACSGQRTAPLQRAATGAAPAAVPPVVHQALNSPGQPLEAATRAMMEPRFGYDFSRVRVHTDAKAGESARAVNAMAYTVGREVVFGAGQYAPRGEAGRRLIAHELAHVAQQDARGSGTGTHLGITSAGGPEEAQADQAADAIVRGNPRPSMAPSAGVSIQRKVELRDVGRGEQSGFARLPELIDRLNAMSQGLRFSRNGRELAYEVIAGGTLSGFDNQMQEFIDQEAVIPLRFTNRHGLLGDRVTGFHDRVEEDAWSSGYVDIDDLLASTDLGLQSVLVHFIRERSATRNYARRIGSPSLDTNQPGPQAEFGRVHAQGIEAEVRLLRDFFADPTIRNVPGAESGDIARVYVNSRRDHIRTRVTERHGAQEGVDAVSVEVVTRDGVRHTPEEYRQILEEERIRQQVERERLGGATEHVEGGRRVPAP